MRKKKKYIFHFFFIFHKSKEKLNKLGSRSNWTCEYFQTNYLQFHSVKCNRERDTRILCITRRERRSSCQIRTKDQNTSLKYFNEKNIVGMLKALLGTSFKKLKHVKRCQKILAKIYILQIFSKGHSTFILFCTNR